MIYWLLYVLLEARIQAYLIDKKGWKPIYIQLFLIRGIIALFFGYFILNVSTYQQLAINTIFQASSFWIFFDIFINYFRHKPFLYKGKNSGWLDKLPYSIYIPGKIIALIVMIVSFIIGLKIF